LQKYPAKREYVFYSFYAARTHGADAPEVEELIRALEGSGVLTEAEKEGQAYITQARNVFSAEKHGGFLMNEKGRVLVSGLLDLLSGGAGDA
jgi:hypothetical protein